MLAVQPVELLRAASMVYLTIVVLIFPIFSVLHKFPFVSIANQGIKEAATYCSRQQEQGPFEFAC